jgi:hypothetical protein
MPTTLGDLLDRTMERQAQRAWELAGGKPASARLLIREKQRWSPQQARMQLARAFAVQRRKLSESQELESWRSAANQ